MSVDTQDVITCATFCDDRLRGLGVASGRISRFPIDLRLRPYNTLALPCECVMQCGFRKQRSTNYKQKHHLQGNAVPAGCRVTLPRRTFINMSINTMRSRLFPVNSASVCLRFLKFRPQFCESCGAIYRWIGETFSALQSTSGPVTDVENSFQIDA